MKKSVYFVVLLMALTFAACSDNDMPSEGFSDLVVYGNIFTSEDNGTVQAFAVKDGIYIYVGNEHGVKKYICDKTQVIDHRNKGMVMAGCTEGHGHYFMSNFYENGPFVTKFNVNDDKASILQKLEEVAKKNPTYVYGFGFDYAMLVDPELYPHCDEIDKILKNVPVYLADGEGHKGIANTCCMQKAGILDENGKVKGDFKFRDGVATFIDGTPTGALAEQAGTYVRVRGCVPDDKPIVWEKSIRDAQQQLNKLGYTAAFEGWANKFCMTTYDVARDLDDHDHLTLNLGMAYEIENLTPDEITDALNKADDTNKKYSGKHIHANYVKLFMDGTPESGTGYMIQPSESGINGKPTWQPDELERLTLAANAKGLTLHIHAMGDHAVKNVVDAYVKAHEANYTQRNQIVHLRNVAEDDYKRMADNNIFVSSGVLWHQMSDDNRALLYISQILNEKYIEEGYPYQAFIDHGVRTSIHTDAPATSGAPTSPFGIMEVAFTGTATFGGLNNPTPWDEEGLAKDRAQFLRSLTIEGAYQMSTEKTRGSIAVGKFADFILLNRDVFECPLDKLHEIKVLNTYFEGKCVFKLGN